MNEQELLKWVTDDIDGRFWLEDRIEEVLRGSRNSAAFDQYESDMETRVWEAEDAGHAEGFEEGFEEAKYIYETKNER